MSVSSIYHQAVEAWGERHQLLKALEELGELQAALARYMVVPSGVDMRLYAQIADHVSEEIADVEIMLCQVKVILGNAQDVLTWKNLKRDRLAARIREARA